MEENTQRHLLEDRTRQVDVNRLKGGSVISLRTKTNKQTNERKKTRGGSAI